MPGRSTKEAGREEEEEDENSKKKKKVRYEIAQEVVAGIKEKAGMKSLKKWLRASKIEKKASAHDDAPTRPVFQDCTRVARVGSCADAASASVSSRRPFLASPEGLDITVYFQLARADVCLQSKKRCGHDSSAVVGLGWVALWVSATITPMNEKTCVNNLYSQPSESGVIQFFCQIP